MASLRVGYAKVTGWVWAPQEGDKRSARLDGTQHLKRKGSVADSQPNLFCWCASTMDALHGALLVLLERHPTGKHLRSISQP